MLMLYNSNHFSVQGTSSNAVYRINDFPDLILVRRQPACSPCEAERCFTWQPSSKASMLRGYCWIAALTSMQQRRWTKPELAAKHPYSMRRHSERTLGFRSSNCWWSEAPILRSVQDSQGTMRSQGKWWSARRLITRCYFLGTRDQRPLT